MGPKPKPKKASKRKGGEESLTKEEKEIAYYVRFNCTNKTTMFAGNEVKYFKAADAIECLAKSKWGAGQKAQKFAKEADIVTYMNELLMKGLFFRARKLLSKKKPKPGEESSKKEALEAPESSKGDPDQTPKKDKKKGKRKEKDATDKEEAADATEADADKDDKEEDEKEEKKDGKKKKRKVKLEFNQQEQIFFDSGLKNDVYVWHYDPSSWMQYFIGTLIVLGSIGVCLFPLWPPEVRLGVYYLSVVAMGGVGVLIGLIVLRTIVFAVVWLCSMGKHHLWILPNLTEDCGFFESFKPAYDYKCYPSSADKVKADKAKADAKKAKEEAEEEEEDEELDEAIEEEHAATDASDDPDASQQGSGAEEEEDGDSMAEEEGSGPGEEDEEAEEEAETSNARRRKGRRVRRENDDFEIVN